MEMLTSVLCEMDCEERKVVGLIKILSLVCSRCGNPVWTSHHNKH